MGVVTVNACLTTVIAVFLFGHSQLLSIPYSYLDTHLYPCRKNLEEIPDFKPIPIPAQIYGDSFPCGLVFVPTLRPAELLIFTHVYIPVVLAQCRGHPLPCVYLDETHWKGNTHI